MHGTLNLETLSHVHSRQCWQNTQCHSRASIRCTDRQANRAQMLFMELIDWGSSARLI